jgi:hypothetical protein
MTSDDRARIAARFDPFHHAFGHGLSAQKRTFEINPHHAVEIFFLEVEKIRLMHDTGIVDENIDLTQIGNGEGQEIVNIELVAHVSRHCAHRTELLQILGCTHGCSTSMSDRTTLAPSIRKRFAMA